MRTGSPVNAQVKGQHEAECAWFAIADSLPGLSISAGCAAHQILSACARGDAELTIGLPARAAVMLSGGAPSCLADDGARDAAPCQGRRRARKIARNADGRVSRGGRRPLRPRSRTAPRS